MTPEQHKLTGLYLHDAERAGAELDSEIAELSRRREWIRRECARLRELLEGTFR